jgi:hypothetical protein
LTGGVFWRAPFPWSDADFLGRMLSRDEALRHPWLQEVFHITDHIASDDPDVREYFSRPS